MYIVQLCAYFETYCFIKKHIVDSLHTKKYINPVDIQLKSININIFY